jgi:fatty-acyl-CoA synthase
VIALIKFIKIIGLYQITRFALAIKQHGFNLMTLLHAVKDEKTGCFQDDAEKISYQAMYDNALCLAQYFQQHYNIKSGSRVLIISTNNNQFIASMFAVSALGADIFLINPHLKAHALKSFLSINKYDLVIANQETCALLNTLSYHHHDYAMRLALASSFSWRRKVIQRKKSSITIMTSGSTGKPRQEKRNFSALHYLRPLIAMIEKLSLKKYRSVFISAPLFHGYGFAALLMSIFLRQQIKTSDNFNAAAVASSLDQEKFDVWIVVPAMIQKLLALQNTALASIQSIKCIISGGDVLPPNIVHKIDQLKSIALFNLYGTSETGVCSIATWQDLKKYPGTLGKIIPGIEVKIASPNNTSANETIGELLIKCAWASMQRTSDYVATGDLVLINEQGYLFYKGRTDDRLVINGENLYPVELEAFIYQYPAIAWAKVSAITDENYITKIALDIVLETHASFIEEEFLSWLSHQVPNYMLPKSIRVLDQVPAQKLMR